MEEARLTFEEQMSAQLSKNEVAPPPNVWVAIDGQLANDELSSYKKRTAFYQWTAAACLALFTISSVYYLNSNGELNETGMSENMNSKHVTEEPRISETSTFVENEKSDLTQPVLPKDLLIPEESKTLSRGIIVASDENKSEEKVAPSFEVLSQQRRHLMENQVASLHSLNPEQSSELNIDPLEKTNGVPILSAPKLEDNYTKLWAGVSMGAGSFNPGFQNSPSNLSMLSDAGEFMNRAEIASTSKDVQSIESFPTGNSVSGGINVGGKLNNWLVLSSGVHYSAFNTGDIQSVAYVNNQTNDLLSAEEVQSAFAQDSFSAISSENVEISEISLNNEFQYVTIPLKAGVILLDKKFNITLNGGISSNILINANINATTIDSDIDNSQNYESMYFNFLSSVEFGYNFMDRYQLSIEPNYNQAISNFTSTTNLNQGRPKNFGLAVGIRYNF
ncbi:MAG: hypothetical protein JXR07_11645 [Reichenbachiella sp.]